MNIRRHTRSLWSNVKYYSDVGRFVVLTSSEKCNPPSSALRIYTHHITDRHTHCIRNELLFLNLIFLFREVKLIFTKEIFPATKRSLQACKSINQFPDHAEFHKLKWAMANQNTVDNVITRNSDRVPTSRLVIA